MSILDQYLVVLRLNSTYLRHAEQQLQVDFDKLMIFIILNNCYLISHIKYILITSVYITLGMYLRKINRMCVHSQHHATTSKYISM